MLRLTFLEGMEGIVEGRTRLGHLTLFGVECKGGRIDLLFQLEYFVRARFLIPEAEGSMEPGRCGG